MPKASKSSASSGTRKKHARKAADIPADSNASQKNAKFKPSKKEIKKGLAPPPKKSYIPPSKLKPLPAQVDPLDGLGYILPAEVVVVLRGLAKKDGVTKSKALEELEAWIRRAMEEDAKDFGLKLKTDKIGVLVTMLPVWLHRYPALSVHQSRRTRQLTALIHALLLDIPDVRAGIISLLESGPEVQSLHVLGSWCLSAWDIDRVVAARSIRSWNNTIGVIQGKGASDPEPANQQNPRHILEDRILSQAILPFIITTIMDPAVSYFALNPSFVAASGEFAASSHPGTTRRGAPMSRGGSPFGSATRKTPGNEVSMTLSSRVDDESESVEDRNGRLRVGAMGALGWFLDTCTPTEALIASLHSLLSSPVFWTVLHHAIRPPFIPPDPLRGKTTEARGSSPSRSDITEGFGAGQTIVRRAGWGIVHALVGGRGSGPQDIRWRGWISQISVDVSDNSPVSHLILRLMSSAILRSAFVEPDPVVRSSMWEPLLVFLTKINNAWVLDCEYGEATLSRMQHAGDDSDTGSESSVSVDEESPTLPHPSHDHRDPDPRRSMAYSEFLTFLSLGCNGSPIHGYPTVLVVVSTISKEILSTTLPALFELFDALWSAIVGQVLSTLSTERARGIEAFLGAWGDCLLWVTRKLVKQSDAHLINAAVDNDSNALTRDGNATGSESLKQLSRELLNSQFAKFVGELGDTLRVDAKIAGLKIVVVLEKVEKLAGELFDDAWTHISTYAQNTISRSDDETRRKYALSFLATLYQHSSSAASKLGLEKLVSEIAVEIVTRCQDQEESSETSESMNQELLSKNSRMVEMLLEQFGYILTRDEVFTRLLDSLLTTKMSSLISQPFLILAYLKYIADISCRLGTWHLLLSTLGSSPVPDLDMKIDSLKVLLDATNQGDLAGWAKPQGRELQGLAKQILARALDGDSVSSDIVVKLMQMPGPFIDVVTTQDLVSSIVLTFDSHIKLLIQASTTPIGILSSSLKLAFRLALDVHIDPEVKVTLVDILPRVFVLGFVMPHCMSSEEEMAVADLAKQFWTVSRDHFDDKLRSSVILGVKLLLKDLMLDTDARPRPVAILDALPYIDHLVDAQPLDDALPTPSEFSVLLSSVSASPIDGSLAIVEALAPCSTSSSARRLLTDTKFDGSGFSPYARGVSALLHVLATNRYVARENMWALQHALALAQFANEVLQVPEAESPVFRTQRVAATELQEITRLTQQVAAFLLTSAGEESWHQDVVDVLSGKALHATLDSVGEFVRVVFKQSKLYDAIRDSLVLYTVLRHVLRSATKEDADRWIELARSTQEQALQTSLAISLAVTEVAPEPPKLDRYRNELASKLTGIPSSKVNTTGLRLLRSLSALAPDPESEVVFLPQQRAVYLLQALQAWVASDDDLDESVESEIPLVLFNLAPILQNVHGAHWEFTMDLIENNIENSSFRDADTLVILSRTLRLLTIIRDLASSNKYLRELYHQRSKTILVLVRDLMAAKTDRTLISLPRAICREQALSILQELPGSLMNENTLSTMCHLLTDPSVDVQKMAYHMLQQAAATRTEHLVVEAGVDSENTAIIDLPSELVLLLQNGVKLDDADFGGKDPLAYLLGWMIVFDLFTDASLRVKNAYVDHLRTSDLVGVYFLPNVFEILGVGASKGPCKLEPWAVDEYWLPFYDADAPQSLQVLAAHVYHRALLIIPSLIRTYWEDLKDRQLSAAIAAFTSSYFSPVLVASELVHVKSASRAAAAGEALNDETFNVKVASAINDVTATFTVDDQQMEIGIKLPAGYPLKTVDVRPIRRVGVPEKVWRKWLFAVRQVVTSHNGRIVDGLVLFKKTVTLHFEGQVECAICYSILHVVDRSLPAKPCKTCKNRFHAGCLYKWFNTSHSSSCPLCRSDIM